jgi:hypothetical protein
MYRKIEPEIRKHKNDAAELFSDSFILMRMDGYASETGDILYVGDDYSELFSLAGTFDDPSQLLVVEGMTHRYSLGGFVVGT